MSKCGSPGCEDLNISLIATGVYTSRNINWFDAYSDGVSDNRYTILTKMGGSSSSDSYDFGECSVGSSTSKFSWADINIWSPVVDDEGEIIKGWRRKIEGASSSTSSASSWSIADPNICCEGENQSNSKYSYIWNYPEMQIPAESCQGSASSNNSCGGSSSGPANCSFIGGSETSSSFGGSFTIFDVYNICDESAARKIEIAKQFKQRYGLFISDSIMHPYISEDEIIIKYFNFIPALTTDQKIFFDNNYLKVSGRILLFLSPIFGPPGFSTPCCDDNFLSDRLLFIKSFEFTNGCFKYVASDCWENKEQKQDFIFSNQQIRDQFKYDSGFELGYCVKIDCSIPLL